MSWRMLLWSRVIMIVRLQKEITQLPSSFNFEGRKPLSAIFSVDRQKWLCIESEFVTFLLALYTSGGNKLNSTSWASANTFNFESSNCFFKILYSRSIFHFPRCAYSKKNRSAGSLNGCRFFWLLLCKDLVGKIFSRLSIVKSSAKWYFRIFSWSTSGAVFCGH